MHAAVHTMIDLETTMDLGLSLVPASRRKLEKLVRSGRLGGNLWGYSVFHSAVSDLAVV
jgi:hypothetical protein